MFCSPYGAKYLFFGLQFMKYRNIKEEIFVKLLRFQLFTEFLQRTKNPFLSNGKVNSSKHSGGISDENYQ